MDVVLHKEIEKVYIKLLEECDEQLKKLYSELSDEEQKIISFRKFASYYTFDFDIEHPESIMESPKISVVLRLKTVEELFGSVNYVE